MSGYKFTDEYLDQLKEQADIVGIIGEHVKLKRAGASWRGPCPFHQGKGPNFSVTGPMPTVASRLWQFSVADWPSVS